MTFIYYVAFDGNPFHDGPFMDLNKAREEHDKICSEFASPEHINSCKIVEVNTETKSARFI